jgi:hypothetical protein
VGAALASSRRRFLEGVGAAAVALVAPSAASTPADPGGLRVNGRRLNQHLADLSAYGRNPQGGVSRVAFGEADLQGRRFVISLMEKGGLESEIDAAGNLLGRRLRG